ncbi:MAG: membrane bound O-acyl transferase family-domain-containing protein, partial [Acidobacteria bacterium]|nr:membrane bound O-acyl transferase family-domain-containing protein [Acidobacteriota bacterium]
RLVLWIAAGVAVFCALELAAGTLELLAAAFGRAIPAVNDAPYRAPTVSEFWSRRWNLVMTRILQERCFKPLVRWNVGLAWFSCFVLSAAIHAYAMGAALGTVPAISWGAFFLIQPVVIIVERRLGVRRWAWYAGRLWTMAMLLLTLPLFAEPVLRLALSRW